MANPRTVSKMTMETALEGIAKPISFTQRKMLKCHFRFVQFVL